MSSPRPEPFEITLPSATLDDLRQRLRDTRWPIVVGDDDWRYGVPRGWMQSMVEYWADEFDWDAQAAAMNRYSHHRVLLDAPHGGDRIPVHYLHAPSKRSDALPLICTHGWPWTFWDMRDIIDPLTEHFEVIVPSLPGFGFSSPLTTAGVNVAVIADLWVELMVDVLGFERFGAYGGDWGSMITAQLGHAHADRVVGSYMSLPTVPGVNRRALEGRWTADEQWMLDRQNEADALIRSHVTVHSLDPQTLSYGLADSPVALAAWLWERRRNWSDCGGDVESVFDRDQLCTLATIYWATGSITSSLRIYHEHFGSPWPKVHERQPVIEAPAGYAVFAKELVFLPRAVVAENTNLVRWSEFRDGGGHFAPAERPDVIVSELVAFFADLGADA